MPGILTRNLGSLLLLYSGSCTLGLTSLFSGAAIGGYLGAFVKLEVSATGWEGVLERTGIYSAFEVSGLVLACAAGLVPVVSAVLRPGRTLRDTAARYWAGLTASLDLWCAAALLILVGAIVESIVIST